MSQSFIKNRNESQQIPNSVRDDFSGQLLTWGMSFKDYDPIKAIGECPRYYGPKPPAYGKKSVGWHEHHILFYIENGVDSVGRDNMSKEEFEDEQKDLQRWHRVTTHMIELEYKNDIMWANKREPLRRRFLRLMDTLSSWDCYECQELYRQDKGSMKKFCNCGICDGCGSKYCYGCDALYDNENE